MNDDYTRELMDYLFDDKASEESASGEELELAGGLLAEALDANTRTEPILKLFETLVYLKERRTLSAAALGIERSQLEQLAKRHAEVDEHGVTVGGRINRARKIARDAAARVAGYIESNREEAPSGTELWDQIQENRKRIQDRLSMSDDDWNSFQGQLKNAIDSVDCLSGLVDLPSSALEDIRRVTKHYRMRMTPYYASLIMPGVLNDPVLLQSVPTGEMIDNAGIEIPPVAADHSPARLVDQFYPRVVTIKVTNVCAMYCTHCLRIAHIGKKDRIYSKEAYGEALDYIRNNKIIRDVLITGGDAFMLPDDTLEWLLGQLDAIEHLQVKRLGTRIPLTTPQRIGERLLDILEASNDKKPVRVVTQVNTAQEITPVSKDAFRRISKRVCAVLNQAVLLRGINDSRYKMWKLCETLQNSYIRPYYIFNCSYRNPQFAHMRVPVEKGRDIVESMYGNISGDAIPRYIATCGGKVPLHRSNVLESKDGHIVLRKPWSGEEVSYPDAETERYDDHGSFAFAKYE